ncbi:Zinc finger BED domain-containing protein 5 [Araneus ventricosus]|uniref:Zinc finger BED domain-containing protein 5 n=1 Tax=Araneus ventricosus TaxID=182803 RepID=A0A4Y2H8E0_ARAVE|nr:Zinc finger BED domain-containing protein 5 [Araneus ventricosus]
MKEKAKGCSSSHCILHRHALAMKKMPPFIREVLSETVKIINFIKSRPKNNRLFKILCDDLGSLHTSLLFHPEIRCLSRGKCLIRLFELRNEVGIFLRDNNFALGEKLYDERWLMKLAYLADIFKKINDLCFSLQGKAVTVFDATDKVEGFKKKVKYWVESIKTGTLDCFPITKEFGEELESGTLLGLSLPVSGPLAVGGGIAFALGNGVVIGTTTKEIAYLEKHLKEVKKLIKKEKERFSSMTNWFSRPEQLENAINSLLDYNILQEIAKEVQKLTEEVTGEKDITEDEFKDQFQQVLKHCMGLMARDSKMIEEYGKELAPAVMTFVFVVFLMNDHNRIVIDCSLITQHLALGLMSVLDFGALAGKLISGSAIAEAAISEAVVWLGVAIDVLIAVLSFIDIYKRPETKHTKKIREAADKIEKVFLFIESVYRETKAYNSKTNATQWETVLVKRVPDDAGHADLRMAVKHYLPEEALGRVRIIRLPTKEKNWLVKVPASHSQMLLQQTEIEIKKKNCLVTH